jgi:hypothetical protein
LRHGEEVCALMLEVVRNHDYGKSRFLRGAVWVPQARRRARRSRHASAQKPPDSVPIRAGRRRLPSRRSWSWKRRHSGRCSKSLPTSPDGVPPRLVCGKWLACSCGSTSREGARKRAEERLSAVLRSPSQRIA